MYLVLIDIVSFLVHTGWFKSKSEIRRAIIAGAITIDGVKVTKLGKMPIFEGDVIRFGKQKAGVFSITDSMKEAAITIAVQNIGGIS